MLQNKDTQTYVISDDATGFIYDRDIQFKKKPVQKACMV